MRRLSTAVTGTALATLAFAALLASCATPFAPDATARAPRLDGFGSLQMQVSTRSPEAQELFTRGMLQAYAFNQTEAVRTFKAALAADPGCALCAWGVAYALGPDINNVDRGDLGEARRYVAWAQQHAEAATPRERGLIEALAARYGSGGKQTGSASAAKEPSAAPTCGNAGPKADPLDIVYAIRMRALLAAYPDDPDILSLYAEALMIETRIDWWDRSSGAPAPGFAELVDRLEQALRATPAHTGLNHYLIHAADSSPAPQRAVAASDRLGLLAPESPHLLHMPSHIYVHVGRFADAVRVNEEALAAEQRQVQKFEAQGFKRSVNWNNHNTHFLWYAALMEGRGELALAQARRMAEAAGGKGASSEFFRGLPLLTLVRLERWPAAAAEPVPTGAQGVATAIGHFGHGMAFAHLGQRAEAAAAAQALHTAVADPLLAGKTIYGDPAAKVLGVLSAELDAALVEPAADADAARMAMQASVDQEKALEANEPPLLGAAAQLTLGDLLLRQKRWAQAEAVFRAELVAQPGSGWALRGLAAALQAEGKPEAARAVEAELGRAWAVADATLRERGMP